MKKLTFLLSLCSFCAIAQPGRTPGPIIISPLGLTSNDVYNIIVSVGAVGGGATNGIQMSNGFGTNTTLYTPIFPTGIAATNLTQFRYLLDADGTALDSVSPSRIGEYAFTRDGLLARAYGTGAGEWRKFLVISGAANKTFFTGDMDIQGTGGLNVEAGPLRAAYAAGHHVIKSGGANNVAYFINTNAVGPHGTVAYQILSTDVPARAANLYQELADGIFAHDSAYSANSYVALYETATIAGPESGGETLATHYAKTNRLKSAEMVRSQTKWDETTSTNQISHYLDETTTNMHYKIYAWQDGSDSKTNRPLALIDIDRTNNTVAIIGARGNAGLMTNSAGVAIDDLTGGSQTNIVASFSNGLSGFTLNSSNVFQIKTTNDTLAFQVNTNGRIVINGSVGFGFDGDFTTGIRRVGASRIGLYLNDTLRAEFNNSTFELKAGSSINFNALTHIIDEDAAVLQFGIDAASPVAQKTHVADATGANATGANWTFEASRGTGTGNSGSILFQTGGPRASSSTATVSTNQMQIHPDGRVGVANGIYSTNNLAYNATTWNGSIQVPTMDAVRDKIESMSVGGGTTNVTNLGDDVYHTSPAGNTNATISDTTYTLRYNTSVPAVEIDTGGLQFFNQNADNIFEGNASTTTMQSPNQTSQVVLNNDGTVSITGAVAASSLGVAAFYPTNTYIFTNAFDGPTNSLDMLKSDQDYVTTTDISITNLANLSTEFTMEAYLSITNASASDRVVRFPASWRPLGNTTNAGMTVLAGKMMGVSVRNKASAYTQFAVTWEK